MASELVICNLALSHLGEAGAVASISPPEGGPHAARCRDFYPLARDMAIESYPWSFALRRRNLATVVGTIPMWMFAYALPNDVLRPVKTRFPGGLDDWDFQDYTIESADNGSRVLYTNVEAANLSYIIRVTDTSKFGPALTISISHLLASFLSGPVIRGKTSVAVRKEQMELYRFHLSTAQTYDANAGTSSRYRDFVPSSIKARG